MSNPEHRPDEITCAPAGASGVEVMTPREVPLGGLRAMTVRRTLPQRGRSLIGAWCFLDHYGPDDVADTGGMSVAPHPHTGLQTVSWLFTGEIEHRDSAGNHAMVRPGELNLMTAGHGISHSEVSTPGTTTLHGAQLWVALPDVGPRRLAGLRALRAARVVTGEGWEARVFLGSLLGPTSPVATATPLLGAEILLGPGASLEVDVEASYEHGVLVDTGVVLGRGTEVEASTSWPTCRPAPTALRLEAGTTGSRLLLLGGPPFGEPIVMWWNFVGRTHEEVVAFRDAWQAQLVERQVRRRPVRHPVRRRPGTDPRAAAAQRAAQGTPLMGPVIGEDGVARCPWAGGAPGVMRDYHDTEWGNRVHGEAAYLERLTLEAFQSGLSWSTILNKRDAFREVFYGFDADADRGVRPRRRGPADGGRPDRPQPGQDLGGRRQRPGDRGPA